MQCANCGKEISEGKYCAECLTPTKTYEPTPEQQKRMDKSMRKINKALSKVFK